VLSEARDEKAELAESDRPDELSGRGSGSHVSVSGEPEGGAMSGDEQEVQLIDANDALKALKAFVEQNNKHRVRSAHSYLFIVSRATPRPPRDEHTRLLGYLHTSRTLGDFTFWISLSLSLSLRPNIGLSRT